jgi:hypothetical protein
MVGMGGVVGSRTARAAPLAAADLAGWHPLRHRPFTVALVNGDRFEVDHPDALVVRDGVAVYIGAGGVPVLFDHEGVGQFIGDLMG